MGLAWEKVRCWRGLILYGILPVDASSSLEPKYRRFISVNGKVGKKGELCWKGAALKMQSCWHGFYTEQLLQREAYTLYTEKP